MKDQMEVCPLSRGMMLPAAQSLSMPLQHGLRFLHPPLPATPLAYLTVAYPWGEYRAYRVHLE